MSLSMIRLGLRSARMLERLLEDGLCIAPATMVELAAAFAGNLPEQKRSLAQAGISFVEPWTSGDLESSHAAWNAYVKRRRTEKIARRPIADILIGGFAVNRQGLVTRNPADFKPWFPRLVIREP